MRSPERAAVWLPCVVAVLAAVASLVGLLWTGGNAPATVVSAHGQRVELLATGLYRYDSLIKGAGNRGSDIVVLAVGLPLLVRATARYRRASPRGALLLAGTLLWFFYLYLTMAVSTAHNELFLVYCALVAASGTALVLIVHSLDTAALAEQLTGGFPRQATATFLAITAGTILVLWGGITVGPLLQGQPPGHLLNATTTVTPALDLGLLLPAFLLAAIMLRRGHDGPGCLLAFSLLVLVALLAPLIPTQTLSQLLAGAAFTLGEVVGLMAAWVVLGLVALTLARRVLRSVDDRTHAGE